MRHAPTARHEAAAPGGGPQGEAQGVGACGALPTSMLQRQKRARNGKGGGNAGAKAARKAATWLLREENEEAQAALQAAASDEERAAAEAAVTAWVEAAWRQAVGGHGAQDLEEQLRRNVRSRPTSPDLARPRPISRQACARRRA